MAENTKNKYAFTGRCCRLVNKEKTRGEKNELKEACSNGSCVDPCCEIIASGGVSTIEDITGLKKLGIDGAIAGKAVYTGTLDLAKAIEQAK